MPVIRRGAVVLAALASTASVLSPAQAAAPTLPTAPPATFLPRIGPGPTAASCLASWNAAPPAHLPATSRAYVQAMNGGIQISHRSGARTEIPGNACIVTLVRTPHRTELFAAPWHGGSATRWTAPLASSGLIAGASPNALLGAGGRLFPRGLAGPSTAKTTSGTVIWGAP